jgi:RHH-type proline utilization regulon transcriptional repressor/proline dehydrogenase/delta 1-pyrroline-5-carboxylate dehydrogenase
MEEAMELHLVPPAVGLARDEARQVEQRTQKLGRTLFAAAERQPGSPADWLQDRLLVLLAEDAAFRTALLRFIDVLAALDFDHRGDLTARLAREYLRRPFPTLPRFAQTLLQAALSERVPSQAIRLGARLATLAVARRFIAAGGPAGALRVLRRLGRGRRYASFDVLGEHVVSELEADAYRDRYLELLRLLSRHPDAGLTTPGGIKRLQISLKLSALTPYFNPADPDGTLRRLRPAFERILDAARRSGVAVTMDIEEYAVRDLTWEIVRQVAGPGTAFATWPDLGVVVQAYLVDALDFAQQVIDFAHRRGTPLQVRLVKGAYWDYETLLAQQMGWPVPVFQHKAATDVQFEHCAAVLLQAYPAIFLAVGSHNLRSHAYVEALRQRLGLPAAAVEHQTLYGMAERITGALTSMGWQVREYVPLGELLPGMAYLVRRVLENASQAGFLLQSRLGTRPEELLRDPRRLLEEEAARRPVVALPDGAPPREPFVNHPPARLFRREEREAFAQALARVRERFGAEYPLRIAGRIVPTTERLISLNPSDPDPARPVAIVHAAGPAEAAQAIAAANTGWPAWRDRPLSERVAILRRAADLMAAERNELAAWIVYEGGKNWPNALADVDEAIDYLRYYTWQAERHAETFARHYRPRGVVGVIPPWNFPLAIPCGMTAGALVTGNAVILKSAEQTPLIGHLLVDVLHRAGVPEDALIHLPGLGEIAGRPLVESPDVDMIAFTGSKAVGAWIYERAAQVRLTKGGLKRALTEMGGKNAIIVFPDADLDEAVAGILHSTFGHANQKCSACSRVFIHRSIYHRLVGRLVEGARSLPIGPADDPGTVINPLIEQEACERVRAAAAVARQEGRVLLDLLELPGASPWNLGPLIVELPVERLAALRTAQEEIFGPVLAVAPFDTEEEAIAYANNTVYGLTAGVFSRSPTTIRRMIHAIRAGNIYVNREITGARVGIEPFGGMGMSGTGPKAGGEEYLWAFVTRREGFRSCDAASAGRSDEASGGLVQSWTAVPKARLASLQRVAGLLERRGEAAMAEAVRQVLAHTGEITEPQPTRRIPGQQNWVDWQTPRGVGAVVTDRGSSPEALAGMVAGALLAGNGVLVIPGAEHRSAAERLAQALWDAGVPTTSLVLSADGMVPIAQVSFALVDVCLDTARELACRLAAQHPGQRELKALLSLADGPRPGEPGFLRRLALPRTIAIRTLRHGADLTVPVLGEDRAQPV